jgi:hypothetical protein
MLVSSPKKSSVTDGRRRGRISTRKAPSAPPFGELVGPYLLFHNMKLTKNQVIATSTLLGSGLTASPNKRSLDLGPPRWI